MRQLLSRGRRRDEEGAIAIIVGLLAVVMLMSAAYAVDIGVQVSRRQQLHDSLDAAAQAGAYQLPGSANVARTEALAFAQAHDPTETGVNAPSLDFWCVVASKLTSGTYQVNPYQLPATCFPGTGPYTTGVTYKSTGRKVACSQILCAIPCVEPTPNTGNPKVACNTIRVYQGRDVPFGFANAGGISKGRTGTLVSVACKGPCGTVAPSPMDVAVVADRTGSMSAADVNAMVAGIKGMFNVMAANDQYVSLATIGRGAVSTTPNGEPGGACPSSPGASTTTGAWVSVPFSNNYNDGVSLNNSSALVKGVTCLTTQSGTGTALASPMKAAARYLLGYAANNLGSLPAHSGPAKKVLIFETDGQPNEAPATGGSTSLASSTDVFANNASATGPVTTTQADTQTTSGTTTTVTHHKTNTYTRNGGTLACNNLAQVAQNAKDAGILVITIAYNLSGTTCDSSNKAASSSSATVNGPEADTVVGGQTTKYKSETTTKYVAAPTSAQVITTLAAAASPSAGVASAPNNACSNDTERLAENSDGDYFFCAASGTDMESIFKTAVSQASTGIRFLKLP